MADGDGVRDAATLAAEAKATEDKKLADITEGVRKQLHGEYERKMEDFKKEMAGKFNPVQKDELTLIQEELDAKIKAQTFTSKDLVEAQMRIANITAERNIRTSNERTNNYKAKIAEFAVDHPDIHELQPEMLAEMSKLSPEEQAYIANAPPRVGIELLYNRVALSKAKSSGFVFNKDQGGSFSGRTSSKGDSSATSSMANALAKGDKAAFDKHKLDLRK